MHGLSSLERKLVVLQQDEAMRQPRNPDIIVDFDAYTLRFQGYDYDAGAIVSKFYRPFPTTHDFHKDKSLVKQIMGPFGSGKSSACLAEIIFHASGMPKCKDGIRHAKVALIRNTYGMLETTTLASWKMWFGSLGLSHETKKPPHIHLKYKDQLGDVEIELIFLALDRPDHLSKLYSIEFSMAYFNESQFIEEEAVKIMKTRIGRYPQRDFLVNPDGLRFKSIIMDTNPPDDDHWIYRWFEIDKIEDHKIFKQPPGLIMDKLGKYLENPGRENNDGLDPSYYMDAARGNSKEWIKVYCMGNYGLMKDGQLVHPSFSSDIHLAEELIPNIKLPLYLGWDFGLTPACTFAQVDAQGRIYTLHEIASFDMDLVEMIDNLVIPLMNTKFKGFKIATSFHDPAGYDAVQTNGESCHEILHKYGLNPDKTGITGTGRRADNLEARLRAVNKTLNRMIGGKPGYLLDGTNCPMLKKAFLKEYKYRRMLVGGSDPRYADKPDKNKFSHIMEAHHYFCVGMDQPLEKDEVNNKSPAFIGVNQHSWGF